MLGRLVNLFFRFLDLLTHGFFVVLDVVERIGGLSLYWIVRILEALIPWRVLNWLGNIWSWIAYGISYVVRFVFQGLIRIAEHQRVGRLLEIPLWLIQLIAPPVLGAVDFVGHWMFSRKWKQLLFGTPAILLLLPLGSCLALVSIQSKVGRTMRYRRALVDALEVNDSVAADLMTRKLCKLEAKVDQVDFAHAMSDLRAKDYAAGYERLKQIAPANRFGYLDAHLCIADLLLRNSVEKEMPLAERVALAGRHLNLVLTRKPDNEPARRMMVDVDLFRGRTDQAIKGATQIADAVPSMNARLMRLYQQSGNTREARRYAKRTWQTYEARAAEDTSLNQRDYSTWALANLLDGRTENALSILKEASERFPDDRDIKAHLADAALATIQSARGSSVGSPSSVVDVDWNDKSLSWLELGFRANPEHPGICHEIYVAMLAQQQPVEQLVEQWHAEGLVGAAFYMMVGDLASSQANYKQAQRMYLRVFEMDQNSARALNNLAWLAANEEPVDIGRALELADRAVSLQSDPRFYETRGQIHLRLQQWQAAVNDLERALNGRLPNGRKAHQSLAVAYEQLGDPEKAKAHRRLGG